MDWTGCRWCNPLTGENPGDRASPEFLAACDAWVMHGIWVTLLMDGPVSLVSGWVRDRFKQVKAGFWGYKAMPITFAVSFTEEETVEADFRFVTSEDQPLEQSWETLFQAFCR